MSLYDENVAKGLKAGGSFSPKDMVSGLMLILIWAPTDEKHKNILPQEYNFQKGSRRNYEVLFVQFSDMDICEQMFYNTDTS